MAGVCSLTAGQPAWAGLSGACALAGMDPDLARCRAESRPRLEGLAGLIARDWLMS